MFFILSKVVTFLIDPLFLILLFSFLCFILSSWPGKLKRFAFLLFLLFYIISTPAVVNRLFYLLEQMEQPSSLAEHYDVVIVLSGMTKLELSTAESVEFTSAADRILTGISFVKSNRASTLLITGGEGALVRKARSEAIVLGEFAKRQGIPSSRLLLEPDSRNTYENAVNTAELMRQKNFKKALLVTSAFHMFRSRGCFRRVGLEVDVYPVDFYAGREIADFRDFFPASDALFLTARLIHETIGIVVYGITGKVDYNLLGNI